MLCPATSVKLKPFTTSATRLAVLLTYNQVINEKQKEVGTPLSPVWTKAFDGFSLSLAASWLLPGTLSVLFLLLGHASELGCSGLELNEY